MKPNLKPNSGKIRLQIILAALIVFWIVGGSAVGQGTGGNECGDEKTTPRAVINASPANVVIAASGSPIEVGRNTVNPPDDVSEKSIVADPKVYVSVCVLRGKVKINGWDRSEVRAFVDGGSKVAFRVREKVRESAKPKWIEIVAKSPTEVSGRSFLTKTSMTDAASAVYGGGSECLSGESIELDLPTGASVKLRSELSDTSIDGVRWADVATGGGSITLHGIQNGITAQTYRGDITVKESGGKMEMATSEGYILAYKTDSNEIGDYLIAKTQSGAITLQSVGQKEVKVNSVTGTINYVGALAEYGKYSFGSGYGTINLGIPAATSCRIDASYGGRFTSELPLQDVKKSKFDTILSLTGRIGGGSCSLSFKTFNGSIRIKSLAGDEPLVADGDLVFNLFKPRFRFVLD